MQEHAQGNEGVDQEDGDYDKEIVEQGAMKLFIAILLDFHEQHSLSKSGRSAPRATRRAGPG
ncbi:MAG: hypothetical protein ACBZ72_08310 [Candidatus Bathyarchaeia archaeon]|jgi:hypothetical protein